MNNSKSIFLLIIILLLTSCARGFKREAELYAYLEKVHGKEVKEDAFYFFLQANVCGACSPMLINALSTHTGCLQNQLYIVLADSRPDILKRLMANPDQKFKLLVDKDFSLEKYGLISSADLFFILSDGKIKYWTRVKDTDIEMVLKKLKKC